MRETIQPSYVSQFKCITSNCEDTCCCGWRVPIDKESYDKYKNVTEKGEDDLFKGKITREGVMQVEGCFAEIALEDNTCSFLTQKKFCSIQEKYGEGYLSTTCSVFPRNYNIVNGKLELVLDMSCPQAARLALLNAAPMQFDVATIEEKRQLEKLPTLNLADAEYPNKLYPYFEEVRAFILALLQNRDYCFEDRLIMLGRFCND